MRNKTNKERERCREYMPCGAGCPGYVPRVKKGALTTERQMEAFTCSLMHLCRYCYRMRFGPHSHGKVKQYLNSAQIRERHLRIHREPAKRLYKRAFYKEWLEFWRTYWRNYTSD